MAEHRVARTPVMSRGFVWIVHLKRCRCQLAVHTPVSDQRDVIGLKNRPMFLKLTALDKVTT